VEPNVVWIGNQKGGVGKTTITANLAGLCAASGWRVLCVDLDPQGNLARHLGVIDRTDHGQNLFDAVTKGTGLEPLRDVRPGLDLIAGGERWSFAMDRLVDLHARPGVGLHNAVSQIAGDYDLVLIDTPPTAGQIHTVAGLLAHFLVVTTGFDDSSLDGLRGTFQTAVSLRNQVNGNPDLHVLGVIVFNLPTQASGWRTRILGELESLLGETVPVFASTVRSIPATAASLQRRGLLVNEGEEAANDEAKDIFRRLRKELGVADEPEVRLSAKSVSGLTNDYFALVKEFQERFSERLSEVNA
jgi:chromosome partitioning protein